MKEGSHEEIEHYIPIKPEDFDFPMSDTFRAFSYQYCGVTDPAEQPVSQEPVIEKETLEVVKNVSLNEIQQIRGQLQYLTQKIQTSTKKKDTINKYLYSDIILDHKEAKSTPE